MMNWVLVGRNHDSRFRPGRLEAGEGKDQCDADRHALLFPLVPRPSFGPREHAHDGFKLGIAPILPGGTLALECHPVREMSTCQKFHVFSFCFNRVYC